MKSDATQAHAAMYASLKEAFCCRVAGEGSRAMPESHRVRPFCLCWIASGGFAATRAMSPRQAFAERAASSA